MKLFSSREACCKAPYGAVRAEQTVTFHLFPSRAQGVLSARLLVWTDKTEPAEFPLAWDGVEGSHDRYTVAYTPKETGLYWYAFFLSDAEGDWYVNRGVGGVGKLTREQGTPYQLTVYDGAYRVPSWFGAGITYHIFPDRFARTEVPPKDGWRTKRVIHENWVDTPNFLPDENGEILNNDFFGGSFAGMTEKLDYLSSLHIGTLYLNPIFEAYSNHRYDTGDYKTIDPMLGDEKAFSSFCAEAEKRGIHVILDGVFSHTGYDSRYFNARGHYDSVGAYQSEQSPYYSWYSFEEWPNRYHSWWGIYTLPETKEMQEEFFRYIIEDEDSVIRRWLRLGASGWRLDVADELPDAFIAKLNAAAKKEKNEAVVIGEVWEDASNKISYDVRRRYLQGGELDSVMNYPLRDGIMAFLNGANAADFAESMECLRENYPREVFYNLMNIIGTHDTPRALTVLGCTPEDFQADRTKQATIRLSGEALARAERRLRIAAVIAFTMPGSPTIYYGDEAGQEGFGDPLNRCTYPWEHENHEILSFYRRLCAIRAGREALIQGELQFLHAQNGILLYERKTEAETLLIAVNRESTEQQIEVSAQHLTVLLENETHTLHGGRLTLQAESAQIYLAK